MIAVIAVDTKRIPTKSLCAGHRIKIHRKRPSIRALPTCSDAVTSLWDGADISCGLRCRIIAANSATGIAIGDGLVVKCQRTGRLAITPRHVLFPHF